MEHIGLARSPRGPPPPEALARRTRKDRPSRGRPEARGRVLWASQCAARRGSSGQHVSMAAVVPGGWRSAGPRGGRCTARICTHIQSILIALVLTLVRVSEQLTHA